MNNNLNLTYIQDHFIAMNFNARESNLLSYLLKLRLIDGTYDKQLRNAFDEETYTKMKQREKEKHERWGYTEEDLEKEKQWEIDDVAEKKSKLDGGSLEYVDKYGHDAALMMAYDRLREEHGDNFGFPDGIPDLPYYVWVYFGRVAVGDESSFRGINLLQSKINAYGERVVNDPMITDRDKLKNNLNERQLAYVKKYGPLAGIIMTYERLLNEFGETFGLAVCPNCGKLCRSPNTKQCFECSHKWHNQS